MSLDYLMGRHKPPKNTTTFLMHSLNFQIFLLVLAAARISDAFLTTSRHTLHARLFQSAISATTDEVSSLPTVQFVDPKTGCEVVLLGCFHGTQSSSQDVKLVVNENCVVALELCATRFADLRQAEPSPENKRPWMIAYLDMISKTIQKRGLPTGLAAAVLGGFSGLQTAISGFTPGLEFKTAMEQSIKYECDIVLADQVVDETLRKVGSIPRISWEMNAPTNITNTLAEWNLHSKTLQRAVGLSEDYNVPRVQLGKFLFRNTAAIQDVFRLTIPPISMLLLLVSIAASSATLNEIDPSGHVPVDMTLIEQFGHWVGSMSFILSSFAGLVLPAVKVILTERDEILTKGINAACQEAGEGGKVVAVLGLLHVNGVAKRMIDGETKFPQ